MLFELKNCVLYMFADRGLKRHSVPKQQQQAVKYERRRFSESMANHLQPIDEDTELGYY